MNAAFKNEVHIHGTLAKDPILKYTSSGKCVANLTLVTKYEQFSEFHRVVLWEKLAERSAELKKGDFAKIVGRLQTRSWDDKQSGQKKHVTEVVAFQISVPGDSEQASSPVDGKAIAKAILSPSSQTAIDSRPISDDDIPF